MIFLISGLVSTTSRASYDWLVWLVIIGLFAVMFGLITFFQKIREWFFRRAMEALRFQQLPVVFLSNPTNWKLFSKAGGGTAENIYHQSIGDVHVTIFDYTYRTGYGRGRSDYHQTPVLLQPADERLHLPCFTVQPRGLFATVAGIVRGIFTQVSDEDWLKLRYQVEGAANGDTPGLRSTGLGAVPLAHFLRKHNGLTIECDGVQMLVYRENSRTRAATLPRVLDEALELLEVTTGCRVGRVSKQPDLP